MKVKATVVRERRHPGDIETLAVLELPRVPIRGEYIEIKGRRYKVIDVRFVDSGKVTLTVDL